MSSIKPELIISITCESTSKVNNLNGGKIEEKDSCINCGCSSEFDEVKDRVCWCDSCQKEGCKSNKIENKTPCTTCGCNSEFDEVKDRVCWCDACKENGCKY